MAKITIDYGEMNLESVEALISKYKLPLYRVADFYLNGIRSDNASASTIDDFVLKLKSQYTNHNGDLHIPLSIAEHVKAGYCEQRFMHTESTSGIMMIPVQILIPINKVVTLYSEADQLVVLSRLGVWYGKKLMHEWIDRKGINTLDLQILKNILLAFKYGIKKSTYMVPKENLVRSIETIASLLTLSSEAVKLTARELNFTASDVMKLMNDKRLLGRSYSGKDSYIVATLLEFWHVLGGTEG